MVEVSDSLESFNSCNMCNRYNCKPVYDNISSNLKIYDNLCKYIRTYTFGNAIQVRLCKDCAKELLDVLKSITEEK